MNIDKTILIVEDDLDIIEMVKIMLEEEGYRVLAVSDGNRVKEMVLKAKPSLILLDLWIPGLDGVEVAKALKEDGQTRHIPIAMVSAHPSAKRKAEEVGINEFLAKPFDLNQLLAVAKKYTNF